MKVHGDKGVYKESDHEGMQLGKEIEWNKKEEADWFNLFWKLRN